MRTATLVLPFLIIVLSGCADTTAPGAVSSPLAEASVAAGACYSVKGTAQFGPEVYRFYGDLEAEIITIGDGDSPPPVPYGAHVRFIPYAAATPITGGAFPDLVGRTLEWSTTLIWIPGVGGLSEWELTSGARRGHLAISGPGYKGTICP